MNTDASVKSSVLMRVMLLPRDSMDSR